MVAESLDEVRKLEDGLTEMRAVIDSRKGEYDALIFPGGSGNGEATALGEVGLDAVRAHVAAGGGYIGTCGGSFLAIQHLLLYGE